MLDFDRPSLDHTCCIALCFASLCWLRYSSREPRINFDFVSSCIDFVLLDASVPSTTPIHIVLVTSFSYCRYRLPDRVLSRITYNLSASLQNLFTAFVLFLGSLDTRIRNISLEHYFQHTDTDFVTIHRFSYLQTTNNSSLAAFVDSFASHLSYLET